MTGRGPGIASRYGGTSLRFLADERPGGQGAATVRWIGRTCKASTDTVRCRSERVYEEGFRPSKGNPTLDTLADVLKELARREGFVVRVERPIAPSRKPLRAPRPRKPKAAA